MDIDIEEFDHVNHAHLRDANNLLDVIIDDHGYSYGLVMDFGCGSGRVTSLIDCRLRCEQILAVDIDRKAINYAQKNFTSPRIQYVVQDLTAPWDQLDDSVKRYEGQVDVIISNRVLHWMEDKMSAIRNMKRLLKKGGWIYANISTLLDLFSDLPTVERNEFLKLIDIPTEREQIEQFRVYFERNKLRLHVLEATHLRQIYDKQEFKTRILPYFPSLTKRFLVETDPIRRNQIMAAGLSDYIKTAFLRLYSRDIIEENGIPDKCELTYGQIRIVAEKCNKPETQT